MFLRVIFNVGAFVIVLCAVAFAVDEVLPSAYENPGMANSVCDCPGFCDMDGDGALTPIDVAYIVNFVYRQLDARPDLPDCRGDNGDWDCDGSVNPIDVAYYINYVYKQQGTGPCEPCTDLPPHGDTKILVHYMPWFQTPWISGIWGWHWTMDHFNPYDIDSNGQRQIASHYYPLTGPYDSRDDDILEYQVLLMKLSGIDGVIVDWYGHEDFADYGILNESTQALFDYIEMAQLLFAVCYEDYTVEHMVNAGYLNPSEVYAHGQEVMLYLQETWFNNNVYLKLSGQPVLLNFGPQYFNESSDWDTLFSVLAPLPLYFSLDGLLAPVAAGSYPWPPMSECVDGVLTQQALNNYLTNFYQEAASWDYLVAGAFPRFHDIYFEAGLGFTYGYLDPLGGATFQNTLDTAFYQDPDVIQIVTWNDYGEGTIIEPTAEFGYQYLELIQDAKRDEVDRTFPYTTEDLAIPLQVFDLRKSYKWDAEVNQVLDTVFNLIIMGDLPSAVTKIDSLNALVR